MVPCTWTARVGTTRQHDGTERIYRRDLLRRSYRDENGKPQKETLANLSMLPEEAIMALRKVLAGTVLVEADAAFEVERTLSHGGSPRCTRWRPDSV
jgi:hypothetical protein